MAHSPLPYSHFCPSMDAHIHTELWHITYSLSSFLPLHKCSHRVTAMPLLVPTPCSLMAAAALSPSLFLSYRGTKGESALRRLSLSCVTGTTNPWGLISAWGGELTTLLYRVRVALTYTCCLSPQALTHLIQLYWGHPYSSKTYTEHYILCFSTFLTILESIIHMSNLELRLWKALSNMNNIFPLSGSYVKDRP